MGVRGSCRRKLELHRRGGRVPSRATFKFDPIPLHDWENALGANHDKRASDPDFMQFIDFRDNEAIAVETGLRSTHRGSWYRGHTDLINEVAGFRAWRVVYGIELDHYSWDYTFRECLLLGEGGGTGFKMQTKVENMNFVDTRIESFRVGFDYARSNFKGIIHNLQFADNEADILSQPGAEPLTILDEGDIHPVAQPKLELAPGTELKLTPNRKGIELHGTVTDSAGTYPFATYRHKKPDM